MASRIIGRLAIFSAISAPIAAFSLRMYLREHPLSSTKTRTIHVSATLSPSCTSSASLGIINPNQHQAWTDSFSLRLSQREIGNTSDEELLARFVKGFFGGWTFATENSILMTLYGFGRQVFPAGFSNVDKQDSTILSVADLSTLCLPPAHSLLFGGNFLVLDVCVKSIEEQEDGGKGESHIDIAFGDDRKQFSGLHRFEVTREKYEGNNSESGGVTFCYSSIACNPSADKAPAPSFIHSFHQFYARTLFRDGIAGVLQTD